MVTGATGHVGANLVRALLDRGESVRTLVRRDHDLTALEGLRASTSRSTPSSTGCTS